MMSEHDTGRYTDEQCGHCGGWMKTDGDDLWCPNSHGRGAVGTSTYRNAHLDKKKRLEADAEVLYGNGKIGHYETRHEAVGEAAILARKDPFPFGEDPEFRTPEERRKDILRRMKWVYIFVRVRRNDRCLQTGTDQTDGPE